MPSKCCSGSTNGSGVKGRACSKYIKGRCSDKTEVPLSCLADHSPSREAYGLILGGTAADTQALSERHAHKNIQCVTQNSTSEFTIKFKTNTFVCGATAVSAPYFNTQEPLNVGPAVVLASNSTVIGIEYEITKDDASEIKINLSEAVPDNQTVEIPVHFVQPKQVCDVKQSFDKKDGNYVFVNWSSQTTRDTDIGTSGTVPADVVRAECPGCAGTTPSCPSKNCNCG